MANISNIDFIKICIDQSGVLHYVNAAGAWAILPLGGSSGNFVETVTGDPVNNADPFNPVINLASGVGEAIGLEATDAMPNSGVGKVNFGITTTGVLQTKTSTGVQQFFAPTGNSILYKSLLNVNYDTATSGSLIVDEVYCILNLVAGDNFSNVGYLNEGDTFTATGTTPTDWTNGTVLFNITRSVITNYVLTGTNNLSNGVWEIQNVNVVTFRKVGAFTVNKTFLLQGSSQDDYPTIQFVRISADLLALVFKDSGGGDIDNFPVQVEVFS